VQVRNFEATVYRYSYTHVVPAKQNHAARFPMDLKAVDDKSRVKILSVNSDRAEGKLESDGWRIITLI